MKQYRVMRESAINGKSVPCPGARFDNYDTANNYRTRALPAMGNLRVWIESRDISDWAEVKPPRSADKYEPIAAYGYDDFAAHCEGY